MTILAKVLVEEEMKEIDEKLKQAKMLLANPAIDKLIEVIELQQQQIEELQNYAVGLELRIRTLETGTQA
jgi:hypothetical protein